MNIESDSVPDTRAVTAHILLLIGYIALLVGAIDPLEGSLVIWPGSALVALGTFLAGRERQLIHFRLGMFILISLGVGALWALSFSGGFGGDSGRSMWWGVLILPYLVGWSMSMWGPDSPRWLLWLGMVLAILFMAIMLIVLSRPNPSISNWPGIILGCTGILTLIGCIFQLRKVRAGPGSS